MPYRCTEHCASTTNPVRSLNFSSIGRPGAGLVRASGKRGWWVAASLLLSVHVTPAACEPNEKEAAAERPDVSALVAAYPDFRLRLEDNELVWSDGTRT